MTRLNSTLALALKDWLKRLKRAKNGLIWYEPNRNSAFLILPFRGDYFDGFPDEDRFAIEKIMSEPFQDHCPDYVEALTNFSRDGDATRTSLVARQMCDHMGNAWLKLVTLPGLATTLHPITWTEFRSEAEKLATIKAQVSLIG